MNSLRKFLALTPAGQSVVLRSLMLLPTVTLLLHTAGMARTMAVLERLGRGGAGALAPGELARLVHGAAGFLRARCLPRSLVLWHFVRHHGSSVEVRLGVSKSTDGGLAAHAWLDFDGLPLNERADVSERYAALPVRSKPTNC